MWVPVVWPSAVGDWGVGAVAEFGLLGLVARAVAMSCQLAPSSRAMRTCSGSISLGPVDEAGDQGDGGEWVAEPFPAAFGELAEGVVDEVVGVVAAVRLAAITEGLRVVRRSRSRRWLRRRRGGP